MKTITLAILLSFAYTNPSLAMKISQFCNSETADTISCEFSGKTGLELFTNEAVFQVVETHKLINEEASELIIVTQPTIEGSSLNIDSCFIYTYPEQGYNKSLCHLALTPAKEQRLSMPNRIDF